MLDQWIKVVHIFAVMAWMAGLFYLPRLFVYHAGRVGNAETNAMFTVMEKRLLAVIMRPAAVVSLLSGFALVHVSGFRLIDVWLVMKLVGVLGLAGYHGYLETCAGRFGRGENLRTERFFRILNEVPTVILLWILVFVVVKPFS